MTKPKQKDLDMSAFIGSGFDVQKRIMEPSFKPDPDFYWSVLDDLTQMCQTERLRPRLNKPQVLESIEAYKQVLVDGAVWKVYVRTSIGYVSVKNRVTSERVKCICDEYLSKSIEWIEFIGIEAGSAYTDWAERHGVPVLEVS